MSFLEGKTALITGGGSGVGRGIALALAAQGANIAICGRTMPAQESTVHEIRERGSRAIAVQCDVTSQSQLAALVATVIMEFGDLDILVNNAMQVPHGTLLEISEETIEAAWLSSPLASLRLMRLCHPYLVNGGSIINVTSGAAMSPGTPLRGIYSATKAALNNISRAAAVEWGPDGIRVNVIAPLAMSDAFASFQRNEPERAQQAVDGVPLGRVGDPEHDIGRPVAFLCSPDAAYITGNILNLDGGGSAR